METLVYSVYYSFMPVGNITLSLTIGDEIFIKCVEKSNKFFSIIFPVDDYYISICDSNFSTKRFEKSINEGKFSLKQNWYIKDSFAIYDDGTKTKILPNTKDIISIIYYLRKLKFEKNDTFFVALHDDKRNFNIKTIVLIEEVNHDTLYCVVPDIKDISIFGGGGLILYYNKEKIPVTLKIKFKYGYLEAKLKERKLG